MPIEPMDLNQEPNNDKPLTSYEIMVKMAKAIEEMAVAISLISERMDSIEKAIAMPEIQIRPTPPANGWGDLLRVERIAPQLNVNYDEDLETEDFDD
jgi:hypothetical protein